MEKMKRILKNSIVRVEKILRRGVIGIYLFMRKFRMER